MHNPGAIGILINSVTGKNIGKKVKILSYIDYLAAEERFEYNGMSMAVPITDHYWWIYCEEGLDTPLGETTKAYGPQSWIKIIPDDDTIDGINVEEKLTINQ